MTTPAPPPSTAEVLARHDAHMSNNYARFPVALVRGEGAELWDAEGKHYLDLFTGFGGTILGHCHRDLIEAVTDQAHKLWHVGNQFHTEPQTRLAEAIGRRGLGGKSFFCHGGADANEAAIKLARLYGKANRGQSRGEVGRYKIISATHSFHGRSFGTMPATGSPKVREGFAPLPPGFVNVGYNDIAAVEKEIDADTVAVLVEPIQGEGGVNVPEEGYLTALRRLCDEHDLLLICDEVWTGCGRTGRWFAHQHWLGASQRAATVGERSANSEAQANTPADARGSSKATPDIMTLAKGVGGGLAVGVCCMTPRLAELYDWRKHGVTRHATTLGGNCLSMAVAARVFEVLERDGLVERAAALGDHAMARLRDFARTTPAVREVRGRGLFLGIELEPAEGWFDGGGDVVKRALERGLIVNATKGDVLRLAPALTIERSRLDEGLDLLEDVIGQ